MSTQQVRAWKILEEYTGSLHRYIFFEISKVIDRGKQDNTTRWAWRKYDNTKLKGFLANSMVTLDGLSADSGVKEVNKFLEEACNSCMPRGNYKGGKKPRFWWSLEISELRKACLKSRRKYKRNRNRQNEAQAQDHSNYKEAKKNLKRAIRKSKDICWKNLCAEVETDPWGLPFKLVTKKLIGRRPIPGLSLPGRLESIVDTLFPNVPEMTWPENPPITNLPEITSAEVIDISKNIPTGKAVGKDPGPDGVPDLVIKQISAYKPELLSNLFNWCLRESEFLTEWKVSKLVLLRKGDKPLENPSTYRPICLLNTIGKLFERIIKSRIENYLETTNGLDPKQFGVRKGRSTIDAVQSVMRKVENASTGPLYNRKLCAVIALDVANAFNTSKWNKIEESLHAKEIPTYLISILRSYMSNRKLQYGENESKAITCGVPQGSVLGPLLWNLMYDDLLLVQTGGNVRIGSSSTLVAFADDVAVVTTGRTPEILQAVTNNSLEVVSAWMERAELVLSVGKTEAVILTNKRAYTAAEFDMRGTKIRVKEQIKYLGFNSTGFLVFGHTWIQ